MLKSTALVLLLTAACAVISSAQTDFWVPTNQLTGGIVYSLTITPNGKMYAGTDLSGIVYKSTNKGNTWVAIDNGLSAYTVVDAVAVLQPQGQLLAGSSDGMFRSTDDGANWTQVGMAGEQITAIAVDSAGWVFAGNSLGQFYRSTDSGVNWEQLSGGGGFRGAITNMMADAHGHIYASSGQLLGRYGGGLYRSLDRGNTWNISDSSLMYFPMQSVALGLNGDLYAGSGYAGVFRSTDDGHYWNSTSWSDTALNGLIVNSKGVIFTGSTGGGVYVSSDNGDSWEKDTTGMITHLVHCFAVDKDGYLYAGTDGEGVYRSSVSTTTGVDPGKGTGVPSRFALEQNFPNPFNPSTRIRYSLSERSWVELTVFDILGREVATLVRGPVEAGAREATWNAAGYASGVYTYRLSARSLTIGGTGKELTQTGKMILLR